jgi:hypothetical protein
MNLSMQFSLRRILLAVVVFATILGMLDLYAMRFGMFRLTGDPTLWWSAIITAAFGAGSVVLAMHLRNLGRIINASVWAIAGFIAAAMLRQGEKITFTTFSIAV